MATQLTQILLNAKGCSGRGVRLRTLSVSHRMDIIHTAAKEIGADGTLVELRSREAIDGVCAMIVQVTEKDGFKSAKDLGGDVAWKKLSLQEISENLDKYFGAKDMAALIAIFKKLHDVDGEEVENILGEALPVTED